MGTEWIFHPNDHSPPPSLFNSGWKSKRKNYLQIREALDAVPRRGLLLHRDRPQLLPSHRHPLGLARAHAGPSQVNTRYWNTTIVDTR